MTDSMAYWRLSDALTIFQAAILITGNDPEHYSSVDLKHWTEAPEGYGAVRNALIVALRNGSLKGRIVGEQGFDEIGVPMGEIPDTVNVDATYVEVPSLIEYLRGRNFSCRAFDPTSASRPDYLDPSGPYYAPKLAAAVEAWLQVTSDAYATAERTPKQRIEKWLREHGVVYGLTKADGNANEEAIEQLSKIANWQPEGGAPRTPTRRPSADKNVPKSSTPLRKMTKKVRSDDNPF